MSYLFQASIGPVQSFIANSRRTQDLRFGSQLLSELAKTAAEEVVGSNAQNILVFPFPNSKAELTPASELNVANKIVAIVRDPKLVGQGIQLAMYQRLNGIKSRAFEKCNIGQNRDSADKQIDDLIEYFWVALPFDMESGDYRNTRDQLEALMAARKNTRDFGAVTWGSKGPKSSIDGQLESVIPEADYPKRGDDQQKQQEKAAKLFQNFGAGPAERLSGVDLLKRKGYLGFDTHFPSTSHMATISCLERLDKLNTAQKEKAQRAWNSYVGELKEIATNQDLEQIPNKFKSHAILGRYDGSLLFEERLVDVVNIVDEKSKIAQKLRKSKEALRTFYSTVDNVHPSPYFAILQADGDHMGAVIDYLSTNGYQAHQKISNKLDSFSRGVAAIVEGKHSGALVYAGGDDVQALVPLHTALHCAQELSQKFLSDLKGFKDGSEKSPTLSVGIAIVHHLDALQDSLQLARTAESLAKSLDKKNKNALAVTVSKRSGSDYSIIGHWGQIDIQLLKLIGFYSDKLIPMGTAYELESLIQRLGVVTDSSVNLHVTAFHEANRIMKRKLTQVEDTKREEIIGLMKEWLGNRETCGKNLAQFVNELLVASLIAESISLSTIEK